MKKTLIILLSVFYSTFATADIGLNVGVSLQIGELTANAKETNSDTQTNAADGVGTQEATEKHLFGTAGFFIEKDFAFLPKIGESIGSRISIGYDNIAHDIDLGTASNVRLNNLTDKATGIVGIQENQLSAEVTDFSTLYAKINLTDWLYIKAGEVTVDVATEFYKGGVKSSDYGSSHELDGTVYGIGLQKTSDNGMFFRLEFNSYDIDGKTVASAGADSTLSAALKDVSGDTGRLSIGKAF